jgi:hypothetical protein
VARTPECADCYIESVHIKHDKYNYDLFKHGSINAAQVKRNIFLQLDN